MAFSESGDPSEEARTPGVSWAATGASLAYLAAGAAAWLTLSFSRGMWPAGSSTGPWMAVGGLLAATLVGGLAMLAGWAVRRAPLRLLFSAAFAFVLWYAAFFPGLYSHEAVVGLLTSLFAVVGLLGAGLWGTLAAGPSGRRRGLACLAFGLAVAGLVLFAMRRDPQPLATRTAAVSEAPAALDAPAPASYAFATWSYGSGKDRRRPEFGSEVWLSSPTVDGSALVSGWESMRSAYWGFDAKALPLNGRVWMPEGDGPFPLALIVHGNDLMETPSDAGYAYLGERLAARGFVVASIDQTFLNSSAVTLVGEQLGFDGLTPAMDSDLRAWLILEHLRLWREWSRSTGHRLNGRVDTDRVALIGHSRGGEAVALAAAYNRMGRNPDDATLPWSFGFGVRAVAAVAPVEGFTRPGGRRVRLRDVSYLVLHGSHDDDVGTFAGLAQYARTDVNATYRNFKASAYVLRANHSQFNTAWGSRDHFLPAAMLRTGAEILGPAEQREVAATLLGAFLEACLLDRPAARAVFRDPQAGLLTQYLDASFVPVATFEEDEDPTTTTLPGGRAMGRDLKVWREGVPRGKHPDDRADQYAATLGWSRGPDATPAFRITLPDGFTPPSQRPALTMSLAPGGPPPGSTAWEPIDLTVELTDRSGRTARLPLSRAGLLQPPAEVHLSRLGWLETETLHEPVPRSFAFRLADFPTDAGFDPSALAEIALVFDRTEAGLVSLDDLGFIDAEPASSGR